MKKIIVIIISAVLITITLISGLYLLNNFDLFNSKDPSNSEMTQDNKYPVPTNTTPSLLGQITIRSIGTFNFYPSQISTIRPDLFQNQSFSVFDILVYLDRNNSIDMEYQFNNSMDTHVINKINEIEGNWWYLAHYDGGWLESPTFRMDFYPYKDEMTIQIYQEELSRINEKFSGFKNETTRLKLNNGKMTKGTKRICIGQAREH